MAEIRVNVPRIMIAAASSNSGKTTVTTALLKAFSNKGKKVGAYKAGPDYIDPMFHSEVIKIPSRNLDIFMLGEDKCRYILGKNSSIMDISVVEGVMGYYDGIGYGTKSSSYELAKLLKCPVILVVNCRGMGISVCALLEGFKNFRESSNIKGVILNKVSPRMYEYYKKIIESNTDIKVFGFMPNLENCKIESRHLGLITAKEIENLQAMVDKLGHEASKTIDLDGLYELASRADIIEYEEPEIKYIGDVKIAVAKDKAFCFYYNDSLEVLGKMGAEIVEFSPLKDEKLPDGISGLYLGGGYPELHMEELSKNKSMLQDIKQRIKSGLPTFAECGGYMYLLKSFKGDKIYELVGAVEGESYMTDRLNNFGYATLVAQKDNLMCKKGESIGGHEFHYSYSTNPGDAFKLIKPESNKSWNAVIADETKFIGYPHINLLGNIRFAENYIKKCIEYKNKRKLD